MPTKNKAKKINPGLASSKRFSVRQMTVVGLLFAVVGIYAIARTFAAAPSGPNTEWRWPEPEGRGFYNFDHYLTIEQAHPEARRFWAHQFSLIGGQAGYLGLQANGVRRSGGIGKLAIFSIWDALEANGPYCGSFDGEGVGYGCSIAYEWVENRPYKLRIWTTGSDTSGTWWSAWVTDTASGQESFIGSIKVRADWGYLSSFSVMWTENFSHIDNCDALPHTRARFQQPTANAGTVKPNKSNDVIGWADCRNTSITPVSGGVIHVMGPPPAQAPPPAKASPPPAQPAPAAAPAPRPIKQTKKSSAVAKPAAAPRSSPIRTAKQAHRSAKPVRRPFSHRVRDVRHRAATARTNLLRSAKSRFRRR